MPPKYPDKLYGIFSFEEEGETGIIGIWDGALLGWKPCVSTNLNVIKDLLPHARSAAQHHNKEWGILVFSLSGYLDPDDFEEKDLPGAWGI